VRSQAVLVDDSQKYEELARRAGIRFFHLQAHENLPGLASEILAAEADKG